MGRLGGVILGEGLHLALSAPAALLGQEAQVAVAASRFGGFWGRHRSFQASRDQEEFSTLQSCENTGKANPQTAVGAPPATRPSSPPPPLTAAATLGPLHPHRGCSNCTQGRCRSDASQQHSLLSKPPAGKERACGSAAADVPAGLARPAEAALPSWRVPPRISRGAAAAPASSTGWAAACPGWGRHAGAAGAAAYAAAPPHQCKRPGRCWAPRDRASPRWHPTSPSPCLAVRHLATRLLPTPGKRTEAGGGRAQVWRSRIPHAALGQAYHCPFRIQ